jgi:hypothetical protein
MTSIQISNQIVLSCRKRQQGNIAGPLDGRSETALMGRAYASQAARHNLAALGHKLLQHADVFVIDVVDFFDTEFADLFPAEELASTTTGIPALPAAWTTVASTGMRTA